MSPRRRRHAGAIVAIVVCLGALGACSSDAGSTPATSGPVATSAGDAAAGGTSGGGLFPAPSTAGPSSGPAGASGTADPTADDLPRVDLIAPAVKALETQLGAPQQYFEINATSKLVNLIIAVNNATYAQAWLYLDGQLSSKEAEPANGHTFAASALTFDAADVLTQVHQDLPDSVLDFFYVLGGADGSVQYTVATTSTKGGQLQVTLGADGKVQEVEPITSGDSVPASGSAAPGTAG